MGRLASIFAALALLAASAFAGERRLIDGPEAERWSAVGRLNIAGRRFCTATLIADSVALTAAHCLFNPRTGRAVPTNELVFVAGLRVGGHAAARRVTHTALPPGYDYANALEPYGLAADLALLALDAPIDPALAPALEVGPAPPGASLALVSYAKDRAHAPSIQRACVVVRTAGALLVIDCEAKSGASGSPVVAELDGRRRVIGVVTAYATQDDARVTIVAMAEPHIETMLSALAQR